MGRRRRTIGREAAPPSRLIRRLLLAEPNVVVAAGDGADGAILVGTLIASTLRVDWALVFGAPTRE